MKRKHLLVVAVALLAVTAACSKLGPITGPAFSSGSANFGVYVALGTSLSAGSQSNGGLVVHHQKRSFTADFANLIRAPFTIPTISPHGYQPLLKLQSLSPLVINTAGQTEGSPTNLAQATAYNNMAVPGAILFDVADSALYYNAAARGAIQVKRFQYIARHRGTLLAQALSLAPTFVTFEFGSNEVLGSAINGNGTPLLSAAQFGGLLHGTLEGLHAGAPAAKLALINVPDVTTVPFCTTIKPWVVNPATGQPVLTPSGQKIPLIGPGGLLAANDLVLLTAIDSLSVGTGLPLAVGGNNRPLLDAQVLSAAEVASLAAAVSAYNAAIASEASTRGGALVDLNGLLHGAATTGIPYQGQVYTNAFITGGLFSLDGFHPNDFAHGLICNRIVDAVNSKFGAHVPHADLSALASATASSMRKVDAWPRIEGVRDLVRSLAPWAVAPGSIAAAMR